jgi:hypothetical protein
MYENTLQVDSTIQIEKCYLPAAGHYLRLYLSYFARATAGNYGKPIYRFMLLVLLTNDATLLQ